MVSGMNATAAHYSHGRARSEWPGHRPARPEVAAPERSVPAGAGLTDAQFDSYKAGNLYVSVHDPNHKGGEIRAHLKP